ncbi:iron-sulfur cluster assembly protein [bacterium]|nr:iron-sulfur cluster assembly protein [bacterium]
MPKVSEEQVLGALATVNDPEINVNIVDLGLIYNVDINDADEAHVIMTLTTPGCPMSQTLAQGAEQSVMNLDGIKDVLIEIVFDPPWTPAMMSDSAKKLLGIE